MMKQMTNVMALRTRIRDRREETILCAEKSRCADCYISSRLPIEQEQSCVQERKKQK